METLSEQSEEKLKEYQGTTRDAAIAFKRHVSPLRGKGWVIHNWGLVRTCVRILRVSIGMGLECFRHFLSYTYNYNYELYMSDKPIVVKWYAIVSSVNPIIRAFF